MHPNKRSKYLGMALDFPSVMMIETLLLWPGFQNNEDTAEKQIKCMVRKKPLHQSSFCLGVGIIPNTYTMKKERFNLALKLKRHGGEVQKAKLLSLWRLRLRVGEQCQREMGEGPQTELKAIPPRPMQTYPAICSITLVGIS